MLFKINKEIIIILKKTEILSAISMRLVKITGKNRYPLHPKHLLNETIWYKKYLRKQDLILDLGAGSCQADIKISYKVKKIFCVDIDKNNLYLASETAKKKNINNIIFLNHNLNKKLPFKNNNFDKIICSDVLEHLNKRDFALCEIKRVLKPNGLLFLVTDNPNTSWKKRLKSHDLFFYADLDHKYEYPIEEIIKKLKDIKFKIKKVNTVTYDTPLKGVIDLIGGISLTYYKKLKNWKSKMVKKNPFETTGFRIVAEKV